MRNAFPGYLSLYFLSLHSLGKIPGLSRTPARLLHYKCELASFLAVLRLSCVVCCVCETGRVSLSGVESFTTSLKLDLSLPSPLKNLTSSTHHPVKGELVLIVVIMVYLVCVCRDTDEVYRYNTFIHWMIRSEIACPLQCVDMHIQRGRLGSIMF